MPGSILANCQTPELAAYTAGQIARAAAVCCVDEIVVWREGGACGGRRAAAPG